MVKIEKTKSKNRVVNEKTEITVDNKAISVSAPVIILNTNLEFDKLNRQS